ncbi:RNA polymerase subunit sigma-24 [Sporosarcina sp. P13]|uniref:RNA polymerase sigma factor n=1 Tax=Sporosarcina sp. P13 TaxID=2048263 RepID=UPI000C16BC58|nr:RNA polymerase sigma factor [Sporosarcina sp. P13]PIC65286.1 RNA polymerase subunit sigma-24 [Sporosarcina sp. P13]
MKELEKIYKDIQPKIYAFFLVNTNIQAVAEDLTHDVFYEACKSIRSFQKNSTLQTWLFSIANNLLKKYYRSTKYEKQLQLIVANEKEIPEKSLEEKMIINEETKSLIKQIQALDDLPKKIVVLRIFGELSYKEIGELVGKTENYVRVTFHRTKLKLQKETEA